MIETASWTQLLERERILYSAIQAGVVTETIVTDLKAVINEIKRKKGS